MINTFKIRCKKQPDIWEPAACMICNHFSCSRLRTNLGSEESWCGWVWSCDLNQTDQHRYHFRSLWQTFLSVLGGSLGKNLWPPSIQYDTDGGEIALLQAAAEKEESK